MRPGLVRAVVGGAAAFALGALAASFLAAARGVEDTLGHAVAAGYLTGLVGWIAGLGGLSGWLDWALAREAGHPERAGGWRRYFAFTTDHKVIGIQYLVTSLVFFVVAGLAALLLRVHLAVPGSGFLDLQTFITLVSLHGTVMIAVALIAIVGGLGNYLVPLMIGARDMAFPRLNALSYWLLPPAALAILATPFAGGLDIGWTGYPPLSERGPVGKELYALTLVTVGVSSILGGVNFLTTVLRLRAPAMSPSRIPIFVWAMAATSIIATVATSALAGALIMLLFDRLLGTAFFDPRHGGDPLLYQNLFWFYSHPAVYVMILPAFGVVLDVLPVHARKPLFAYRLAVGSFFAIVALGFVVWAHHMFVAGIPEPLMGPFMLLTELISVPTGIVFLCALGTIWLGRLRLTTPMLFALGFVSNFVIGGITGIFLADVPTDIQLTDSYFVVAHFHYTIVGGMIFGLFTGLYHWFPKITGRQYSERLGRLHFWLFFAAFNATFLPMFWVGLNGMRRRVADYPPELAGVNLFVSVASFVIAVATTIFLYNGARSWLRGARAVADPWQAYTLEWRTSSPPPVENFPQPPVVGAPYPYGSVRPAAAGEASGK